MVRNKIFYSQYKQNFFLQNRHFLCVCLFEGMIERLSPGTRKIELFGRPHNIQPNWITLGNQVDGIRLVDPELIESFKKRYPTGNCMAPPPETSH